MKKKTPDRDIRQNVLDARNLLRWEPKWDNVTHTVQWRL